MGLEPIEQQPDLPAVERRVLERWREREVFARSLEATADGPRYVLYEGPPTANGTPGVHHVEARVFKDVFPRHRTMKGFHVPRKGGWDCHGIPVELEIERELGLSSKRDIEAHGIAEFNARCRESVTRYVEQWVRLTERIGFWIDTDDPYWTMSTEYVESVWWSLARLWRDGLIVEGHRVTPHCPRCGTALSDHEVAQGYAETDDPSVHVRFPLRSGRWADRGASLLVWTTTPWTLISNTAAAVHPEVAYVLADPGDGGDPVVVAADLADDVLDEGWRELDRSVGADLAGAAYRAPIADVDDDHPRWRTVLAAEFVTVAEGTGVVHLAPAFGADDLAVAEAHGLPVHQPVDEEGRFTDRVPEHAGAFVKDADAAIVERLDRAGALHRSGTHRHTYPFCWRCKTPLIYYAKPSWYIRTTEVRDRMLRVNADVDWHPEHIRDGRYGDWLANNVDWSLSRERYWGTPLPLWRCESCDGVEAVGSLAELGERAGRDLSDLDPHRPAVDEVELTCGSCGGRSRRVPEVIDAWYDSGAMPFAQHGYPHREGSAERLEAAFPADLIAEAIDQTRGWFYSLMAVSTLLFDAGCYRSVLCLGHIVDADGRKMSKSVGNVIDPWELIDRHGADALRWLLLTDGSPWEARRVGHEPVAEVVRRFLLTLWNTASFLSTYAAIDGWDPAASPAPPPAQRPVLDRWALAELDWLVEQVDAALDAYDATTAGRALAAFVDDLSNWYVRRARGRFWRAAGVDDADKAAAYATLHQCLATVSALLAPFVPFVADELHERLVRPLDPSAPDSVHLASFPQPTGDRDDRLREAMRTARRVAELGRRARSEGGVPVRQPLRRALVGLPDRLRAGWEEVAPLVADELNLHAVELASADDGAVARSLAPRFPALGPDFGPRAQQVGRAVRDADADRVLAELAADGRATLQVDGEAVEITESHVEVREQAREGWQVAADGPVSVALDLAVDDELRREGVARELIRAVNDARKRLDLRLDDRVRCEVAGGAEVREALEAHRGRIAGEVLADQLAVADQPGGRTVEAEVAGEPVTIGVEVTAPGGAD